VQHYKLRKKQRKKGLYKRGGHSEKMGVTGVREKMDVQITIIIPENVL